uniref:Uncharacterized protein n=1 Tax=Tetranychus urticae TaxID=32264 RepID=T1JS29_TETUR
MRLDDDAVEYGGEVYTAVNSVDECDCVLVKRLGNVVRIGVLGDGDDGAGGKLMKVNGGTDIFSPSSLFLPVLVSQHLSLTCSEENGGNSSQI